jgi:hypothetical protein
LTTGRTLLAWNNYVLTSGLAATSAALSISNVQDERGSAESAWQTVAGTTQNVIVTITPAATQSNWRVFGLFRTNLTPYASVVVTLYNNPASPTFVWNGGADGPEPGFGQSIVVADDDMVADYCTIEIDDPGNPDGFLNVPLIYVGPAWLPLTGLAYDSMFGLDAMLDEAVSRGGQEYPTLRYQQRRGELSFMGIRQGEVLNQLYELQATAHRGNNVLCIPDITSANVGLEAIYGRLNATADIGYPYAAADRRSWRARLRERL